MLTKRQGLLLISCVLSAAPLSHAQQASDISVSLDEAYRFVIHGSGQELQGFDFRSPSAALTTAASSAPFQFLISNTNSRVTYGSLGVGVPVDPTAPVLAGWNPLSETRDIFYQFGFFGTGEQEGPFDLDESAYVPCDVCVTPSVLVDTAGRIDVTLPQPLVSGVELVSSDGWLVPLADTGLFQAASNTNERIMLTKEGGISDDDLDTLDLMFDLQGQPDLSAGFMIGSGSSATQLGPWSVPSTAFGVPEPSSGALLVCGGLFAISIRRRSSRWAG